MRDKTIIYTALIVFIAQAQEPYSEHPPSSPTYGAVHQGYQGDTTTLDSYYVPHKFYRLSSVDYYLATYNCACCCSFTTECEQESSCTVEALSGFTATWVDTTGVFDEFVYSFGQVDWEAGEATIDTIDIGDEEIIALMVSFENGNT